MIRADRGRVMDGDRVIAMCPCEADAEQIAESLHFDEALQAFASVFLKRYAAKSPLIIGSTPIVAQPLRGSTVPQSKSGAIDLLRQAAIAVDEGKLNLCFSLINEAYVAMLSNGADASAIAAFLHNYDPANIADFSTKLRELISKF